MSTEATTPVRNNVGATYSAAAKQTVAATLASGCATPGPGDTKAPITRDSYDQLAVIGAADSGGRCIPWAKGFES